MKVEGVVAAKRMKDLKPGQFESIPGSQEGKCEKCGEAVALAPSAMKVLSDGSATTVICLQCAGPDLKSGRFIPVTAPGQIAELKQRLEHELAVEGELVAGYPKCVFREPETTQRGAAIAQVIVHEGKSQGFAFFAGTYACDKPEHPLHFALRIQDLVTNDEMFVEISLAAWDKLNAWVQQHRGH